jgi:hypothetical protein
LAFLQKLAHGIELAISVKEILVSIFGQDSQVIQFSDLLHFMPKLEQQASSALLK